MTSRFLVPSNSTNFGDYIFRTIFLDEIQTFRTFFYKGSILKNRLCMHLQYLVNGT